jgi:hypothetical protein
MVVSSQGVLGVLLFSGGVVRGMWQVFAVLMNGGILDLVWVCEGFCEMVDFLVEVFYLIYDCFRVLFEFGCC